jgi:hypothetical protein
MQVIVTFFLSSIAILALTHVLAMEFYLYWTYHWLDIFMHLLGGVSVALGYASLPFFGIQLPKRFSTISTYLLIVLVVGLFWEVFELSIGTSLTGEEDFVLDTVSDLVLDVLGGALGYYLINRLKDF